MLFEPGRPPDPNIPAETLGDAGSTEGSEATVTTALSGLADNTPVSPMPVISDGPSMTSTLLFSGAFLAGVIGLAVYGNRRRRKPAA